MARASHHTAADPRKAVYSVIEGIPNWGNYCCKWEYTIGSYTNTLMVVWDLKTGRMSQVSKWFLGSEFANFFHATHLSSTFGDLAFPCRARFKQVNYVYIQVEWFQTYCSPLNFFLMNSGFAQNLSFNIHGICM